MDRPGAIVDGVVRLLGGLKTRFPGRPDMKQPLPSPPRTITDARNRTITFRSTRDDDYPGLVAMFTDFDPEMRAQGVPPAGPDAVRRWLDERLLSGPSVVARLDDRVVGHVAFVPDGTGAHELAIFVHQEDQHAGIGTELIRTGLGHARSQGVRRVWLTVEPWKRGIQRWYGDMGFDTTNPFGSIHRMSRYL